MDLSFPCVCCNNLIRISCNPKELYAYLIERKLIQHAMPSLSIDDIEPLIHGLCYDCNPCNQEEEDT